MNCRALLGALLLALIAAPARADDNYQSVSRSQADQMDRLIVPECAANDRRVTWINLEEIGYPLLGDRNTRDAGTRIYTERYEATGCAHAPRRLNVQVFHGGAAAPTPTSMLLPPGETAISAGIMVDLFRTIVPQYMAIRHPFCQSAPQGVPVFLVLDTTRVSGEPFVVDQPWTERWRYRACGEEASFDISFVSNGERVRMNVTQTATPQQ